MTLDTRIYVHDEIDCGQVFLKCQELLGVPPHDQIRADDAGTLANRCGQGLPAWLILHYGVNGPLRAEIEYCDCDDAYACETRCSKDPTYLEVMFDTAYSYSDDQGRGCGDLHACYVAELGRWLDERDVSWSWKNEFTGDIHGGDDRYAKLTNLMSGGADASAWFVNVVRPAIDTYIQGGE